MAEKSMTRRDWFRLRKPPENCLLSASRSVDSTDGVPGSGESVLAKVPLPPNHDGINLDELPTLYEAELSWEQVADLIGDIRDLTDDITLMQRSSAIASTASTRANAREQLVAAAAALQAGRVNRIQVRYSWDGGRWIDTIQRREQSFGLVRIRHPSS